MNVTYYCLEVFIMKDNLGYVHVYCGDGKGKTTTAMGLCTRAAGYGYKVLIYQFMKNNKTSERNVLQQFPNITFVNGLEQEKFSFQMTAFLRNWNGKPTMKNSSGKLQQKLPKKTTIFCFSMN